MLKQKSIFLKLCVALGTLGIAVMPLDGVNSLPLLAQRLPTNPYDGKGYTATAFFPCSVNNASHNKECPGGIRRKKNNSATITVLFPNKKEVTYNFQNCPYDNLKNCKVTSNIPGKLDWGKEGDKWSIGIDGKLFIVIFDAAILGG